MIEKIGTVIVTEKGIEINGFTSTGPCGSDFQKEAIMWAIEHLAATYREIDDWKIVTT
jgi:hypothetical protein